MKLAMSYCRSDLSFALLRLNLSIIRLSLGKNKASQKICIFQIESCAKQQI